MLKELALRVAILADEDRAWLLAMLSATEQARLQVLLDEIRALGLDSDPSVLNALTRDIAVVAPPEPDSSTPMPSTLAPHLPTREEWRRLPLGWRRLVAPDVGDEVSEAGFLAAVATRAPRGERLRRAVIDGIVKAREEIP